jgi:hypothetical protein
MTASEEMLEALEKAAGELGVNVSYEALRSGSSGGLCRVKGEYRLIADKKAPIGDRIATLAQGIAQLDWSGLDLPPRVQARIRQFQMRPDRTVSAQERHRIVPDDPVGPSAS